MGPRGGKCYRWTLEAFGGAISEHVGEAGLQGEVTTPYMIKGRGVCVGGGFEHHIWGVSALPKIWF